MLRHEPSAAETSNPSLVRPECQGVFSEGDVPNLALREKAVPEVALPFCKRHKIVYTSRFAFFSYARDFLRTPCGRFKTVTVVTGFGRSWALFQPWAMRFLKDPGSNSNN